jgi:glycosyltransferase involved in cell wall biosynthesis
MLARLTRALFRFKPDVVLASQFGDLVFAGLAGRLCKALVLAGVRSDGFYELRTAGRRKHLMLGLSQGFIANSHHAKKNLASQGLDARRIAVLPNVIDLEDFDRKSALPFENPAPAGRIVAAGVGSLIPCKRFERFIDALALARAKAPALFGVLAGKDLGAGPALEQRARDLALLPAYLVFAGECDRIPALLGRSRMLVLSSEYEGFPNVILEAMAAGLPVITTPAGDAARIVEDGKTGYVVPAEDTARMAECMVRLAQDPDLSAELGEAGRKRVEQKYDFGLLAGRLKCVFGDFARLHGRRSLQVSLETGPLANHPSASREPCHSEQPASYQSVFARRAE